MNNQYLFEEIIMYEEINLYSYEKNDYKRIISRQFDIKEYDKYVFVLL